MLPEMVSRQLFDALKKGGGGITVSSTSCCRRSADVRRLLRCESVPTALLSTAPGLELKPLLFDVPLVFVDMWIRAKSGRGRARPPAISHGAQQQQ